MGGSYSRGVEFMTSSGPAEAEFDGGGSPKFLMLLTHGAGGGVVTPDLLAARDAAVGLGGTVARVLQPYRVRGARAPGSPTRQDAAWLEVVAALCGRFPGATLIQGGRSNGARLACRTASAAGARGVLALAFPLRPPGRPGTSREDELRAAGTDVLVISGSRDPFGIPEPAGRTTVITVPGQGHGLTGAAKQIRDEVAAWLSTLLTLAPAGATASQSACRTSRLAVAPLGPCPFWPG